MNFKIVLYVVLGLLALFLIPLIFQIILWLFLAAFSLFYNPKKHYDKPSAFSYGLLKLGYRLICSMGRVRIHFKGRELLPENQRFLFVSNHRSKFDNMIQALALKKEKLAFVSKIENFKIPIARRFIARNCYFPLERGNGRCAVKMLLESVRLIRENIASVGIFPEGTRSKDTKLLPVHPGCFKIAEKAKCPIVVGVIRETEKIHKNWPWKKTDVYFEIVKVYTPEEAAGKSTIEIAGEVENIMKKSLEV